MPDKPIVFIGMMGSGKTTIGRTVAKLLKLPFLDNDAEISRRTNKKVADFLREDEQGFRDMEEAVIKETLGKPDVFVFSLGGGSVVRDSTREFIKGKATVIWLTAPAELLSRRVAKRIQDRPSLDGDPEERMRTLLVAREPVYKEIADLVVDSGRGTREEVAKRIAERFS